MRIGLDVDPLSCLPREPGSPSEVAQACLGLVRLAKARHGENVSRQLDTAAEVRRGDTAYAVAADWQKLGLSRDEGLAWLWVAGSLGHTGAARQLSILMEGEALHVGEEKSGMLLKASTAWQELAEQREAAQMTGERQTDTEAASILEGVRDPDGIAARAAIERAIDDFELEVDPPPEPYVDGLVVLPEIGDTGSKDGADLLRRYGPLVGKNLAWQANLPQPGEIRAGIVARWPWAESAAREIENKFAVLRAGDHTRVKLSPILMVGDPGCGKSTIAEWLCQAAGLQTTVLPCGGVADGGGLAPVTRGWATARPSALATTMFQNRICNPAFVLDELDKTSVVGSQNGSVMGTLLSMVLANSYQDTCLQATIDISGVTFVATANDLSRIDPALLDRFNVIRIPSPRPEDFDVLLQNVRQDFIVDKRLDESAVPTLSPDAVEVLRRYFLTKRSARSFRLAYERVVEDLIAKREMAEMERLRLIDEAKKQLETWEAPSFSN